MSVTTLPPNGDWWGQYAIWGAVGSTRAGRIFFGMSSNDDSAGGSAHLYEFNPATEAFADRGTVVQELDRLGVRRPRETQHKIHSRIVEAADGFLYFSSMDENGEADDGSKLPTFGGHLWRRGPSGPWEHLKATPEALIAVAAGGPYVYSLGYFNHVLYQFDTRTKRIRFVVVGSAGGHVSRNFFVDDRGHAVVPRIVRTSPTAASATLVEFDAELTEIGSQPLAEYFESIPDDSHGIVGVVADGARGWFFTTAKGRLYREQPNLSGRSTVTDLGWLHPAGQRYPAAMFRDEQTGMLYAVSMPSHGGGKEFEWITRAADGTTTVSPFPYGASREFPHGALVYGSMARDAAGRFYAVGTMETKPLVLQITPTR